MNPLRAFFPPLPSPRAAAHTGPLAVEKLAELIAAGMKLLGLNTNLAPALDLSTPLSEPILGTRTFSIDAQKVARCGAAFIQGLGRHGILACGKYFPGLGGAQFTNQPSPPAVGKTMAKLWHEDLVPYRALLRRLPLVMVSHAAYKAYDFDVLRPAALSANVVDGLLRVKLAYRGVVVAEISENSALDAKLDLAGAAIQAVSSGCDMLVIRGSEKPIEAALAGLKKGIESGIVPRRRLEESLQRIRLARKRLAPPTGRISKATLYRLARQFESFREKCRDQEQRIA